MSTFKVFSYSVIKLNVLHQLDTDGQKMPYLYLLSNLYFSLILYKSRQSGLSGANNMVEQIIGQCSDLIYCHLIFSNKL